jgi:uncharacterized protein DUF3562
MSSSSTEAPEVADSAPLARDWSTRDSHAQESTVAALALKTQIPRHVVKRLYDEEIATLRANAKVKNFIDVIAGRRVKRQLVALQRK